MYLCLLLSIAHCVIRDQFKDLAARAIQNSTIKVPQGLRENTKYPGLYTFGNAVFTLLRVLSSSQTHDIKGYAVEKNYAAIVKRKNCNISDDFVLLDISKEEFYQMDEVVDSDDKVTIYKVTPIDMFMVFSDIDINPRKPLLTFKRGLNWDDSRNRPKLTSFGMFSAGIGAYFSLSAHARVRFKSIKKAEITMDISFLGKIGAELLVKKSEYTKYPDIPLIDDFDIPIPGFAISFKFLGLKFDFGLYVTIGAVLKDLEKNLKVDIDYFKGYQYTAKRYICIKRHGKSDSGWQTELTPIPSGNIVDGILEDLESNSIKGTLQFKQGVKLKAVIFSIISTELEIGLLEPFTIQFGFSPLACPFPFLYGRFELPLKAYFAFSGVIIKLRLFGKTKKYKLLKPYMKEWLLFHILKTRKHCLFDYRNNNDYAIYDNIDDGYDEDDFEDPLINETSTRYISLDVNALDNRALTKSLISIQLNLSEYNTSTNTQVQLFEIRASPFEDITSKKSYFDASMVESRQNKRTSKISLCFWYYTGTNMVEKSNDYTFLLREYLRKDDGYSPLTIVNPKKTEKISLNFRLNELENLTLNEMYVPALKHGVLENTLEFGEKICMVIKDLDGNSTDYVDENAVFTTAGTLSLSLCDHGVYTYKDEYFQIKLVNINLPTDPDMETNVHYEILAEWGNNFENKSLIASNFSKTFRKGENIVYEDVIQKVRITDSMRLFITISYIHNYNMVVLKQPVSYSEILQIADTKTLVKTEPGNKISCTISANRFNPLVKISCSKANSTHRFITNVYELNSVKPSEYKPQTLRLRENQLYGVLELKKIHPNVQWAIIHLPLVQPLSNFTTMSDEYYQFPFDKDTIYIPFRRENVSIEEITINHVIQGSYIDEETLYFSSKYYKVDFSVTPIALVLVKAIHNQYSVTNVEGTKQTLIDYGDEYFSLLALEYEKDQTIIISSSLIIIDNEHPLAEKTIPNFPEWSSVVYHVWCERADEIIMHDKTTGITIENNIEKDGLFFKINVTPGHVIDFIPICSKNISQPLCYIKQTFTDQSGYAIFRYPDKNGITILDTNLTDLFEQEDRQGLIEEAIKTDKSFYYMQSFSKQVQIDRIYKTKLDLVLRVIDVQGKYKKFCIVDPNGFIVPVSRQYYTDEYVNFMREYNIQSSDERYYDFLSGDKDSCIYATYAGSILNDTDLNDTDFNYTDMNDTYGDIDEQSYKSNKLLSNYIPPLEENLNPSIKICDIAKSIKVSYYQDITQLIPPATFNYTIFTTSKVFENDWVKDTNELNNKIQEYFLRLKQQNETDNNNSLYVLYLPYDEFDFNTSLNEKEYISANHNMTVHYKSGNLNYILPEKYHTIIDIEDSNEINLDLYGRGSLEIKTKSQSILRINGKLNLESIATIKVDKEVKLIEIENVIVTNYTELYSINTDNQSVPIRIDNLTLLEHSKANLTNIEISNVLYIKQTATAILDQTVTVKNSDLLIEMVYYQNDLIPMIQGSLLEPPKTISIRRNAENGPKNNEEYLIFDGEFDCQAWIDRIEFSNSLFSTTRCASYNDDLNGVQLLAQKENRAFISFVKKDSTVYIEKYANGGFIAIIVFTVLDILIIVSITTFVILRFFRKRDDDSSTQV